MARRPATRSSANQQQAVPARKTRSSTKATRKRSLSPESSPEVAVEEGDAASRSAKRAKTSPNKPPAGEHAGHTAPPQAAAVQGVATGGRGEPKPFRWDELEYSILTEIFDYAAHPLDTPTLARWLLSAARICRYSSEAALAALYRSPPLLSPSMAHKFADSVATPPEQPWCRYATKVRFLQVDVGVVASNVYRGAHLDLGRLVRDLPALVHIDLYHFKDLSPYRELTHNLRWTYPASLLQALGIDKTGVQDDTAPAHRLKSWRWNARMMDPHQIPVSSLQDVHRLATFAGLETISFVNFQVPSMRLRRSSELLEADDQAYIQHVAQSLAVLPSLQRLVLESSSVVDIRFLALLPRTIRRLELINCWELNAQGFIDYLGTHGKEIRHLVLHHNQALSLAFLPVLGPFCPNLHTLSMNLTYYSQHEFYNDSRPMYDELLTVTDKPAWPPSIEVIELEQLRQWKPEAAEMFFQSFIDSAPSLTSLRRLSIKAMLDVPWRQRCEFRDKWVHELTRTFLRKKEPPQAARQLQALSHGKAASQAKGRSSSGRSAARRNQATPTRRSGRIASSHPSPSSPSARATRGLREARPGSLSYRDPDTDDGLESSSESEGPGSDADEQPASPGAEMEAARYIQGLCGVVDIKLDNQKPREMQYGMDDFLDDDDGEEDQDDDWTSDRNDDADDAYAW